MTDDNLDMTLVSYGVFRMSDNTLLRTGTCQRALIDVQASEGEEAREGNFTFDARPPIAKSWRMMRREAYPPTGDQLGALVDLARAAKASGMTLPDSVDNLISKIDAVKANHPKDYS